MAAIEFLSPGLRYKSQINNLLLNEIRPPIYLQTPLLAAFKRLVPNSAGPNRMLIQIHKTEDKSYNRNNNV
jgi:hypothetical protein